MTAISRSKTKIWIVAADVDPSTLTYSASTDLANTALGYLSGDIKSYSKSGAENDVESDPVFGGFVDKEKPTTQAELSLEIVPLTDSGKSERWDAMTYAEDTKVSGVYTMATEKSTVPTDRMVIIEANDGTNKKTLMYNNVNVTVLDLEHNADDNRSYNMTLKFSPTDGNGVSNFATSDLAATAMPAFSALDNN
jgi:hypothetical protein